MLSRSAGVLCRRVVACFVDELANAFVIEKLWIAIAAEVHGNAGTMHERLWMFDFDSVAIDELRGKWSIQSAPNQRSQKIGGGRDNSIEWFPSHCARQRGR